MDNIVLEDSLGHGNPFPPPKGLGQQAVWFMENASFIFSITGIILNVLVAFILSGRQMKTNLMFVVSLCFADMVLSGFHVAMPYTVTFMHTWSQEPTLMSSFHVPLASLFSDDINQTLGNGMNISDMNRFGHIPVISNLGMIPNNSNEVDIPKEILSMSRHNFSIGIMHAFDNLTGNDVNLPRPSRMNQSATFPFPLSSQVDWLLGMTDVSAPSRNSPESIISDGFLGGSFTVEIDFSDPFRGAIKSSLDGIVPGELLNLTFKSPFSQYSTIQKFLTAFYLLPRITCVWSMLGISVSLYIVVTKPLKFSMILTKRRGKITVALIWLLAFGVSLGVFIYSVTEQDMVKVSFVQMNVSTAVWANAMFCFIIIVILYIAITVVISSGPKRQLTISAKRSNRKVLLTSIGITGSYFVCYISFIWPTMLHYAGVYIPLSDMISYWKVALKTLYTLNLVIDPLIYAFRLPEVSRTLLLWRTKFVQKCTKICRQN